MVATTPAPAICSGAGRGTEAAVVVEPESTGGVMTGLVTTGSMGVPVSPVVTVVTAGTVVPVEPGFVPPVPLLPVEELTM